MWREANQKKRNFWTVLELLKLSDLQVQQLNQRTIIGNNCTVLCKELKMNNQDKTITRVRVGCTVKVQALPYGRIMILKLISSQSETQYSTMGYKTKNYSTVIHTSDADGVSTISDISPFGKAILNKRAGDIVMFKVNNEVKRYGILAITEE